MSGAWPRVPLGTLLTDIQPDFASGRHNSDGEGIPHFRPMNVSTGGHIERSVMKYVSPGAGRPDLRLAPGDILFNNTNSPELVGKTAYFEGDDSPAYSNHMTRLRVDSARLDARFAALRLHQAWREGWFAAHCNNHVSQASIGRDVLNSLEIELPPLDVQRAIASLSAAVDVSRSSASEHLVAAHHSIEQFRQAVLAAACSGRLTEGWRERNTASQPTGTLIEESKQAIARESNRRPITEPWTKPDWIDIPESWRWAPLRDLAAIKGGIQKQPKRAPKSNSRPYLRVANVGRGRVDVSEMHRFELFDNELETYRLKEGDLLVVEGNGSPSEIGRAAVWRDEVPDCVHQNHIIRARPIRMLPEYLELFWNSPVGSREISSLAVTSAGLYSLSTKKIGAVPVPVPPLDEQIEIVRNANQLLKSSDRVASSTEKAATRLGQSSQAVLAKAFRGELLAEISAAQGGNFEG